MHTIDLVGSCQPLGNNCFRDGSTGPRAIQLQLGCSIKQEQLMYLKFPNLPTLVILWETRSFRRAAMTGVCLEYSSYRLIPMWKRSQLGYDSALASPAGLYSSSSTFPSLCLSVKDGGGHYSVLAHILPENRKPHYG